MNRLRELRKEKGLTTTELGEIIGCSNPTITNYERGYRKPDPETLLKLADYFGVSVDYLLGRDEALGVQMKPAAESELTATEQELLTLYRNAVPAVRELILQVARTTSGNPTDPDSPAGAMALKKQA